MLAKGEVLSPYGAYPAMYVFPIIVFDGEPKLVFARDGRAGVESQALTIVDTTQSAANRQGWVVAQTS